MIRSWLAASLRGEMPQWDEAGLDNCEDVLAVAHEEGVTLLLQEQIKLKRNSNFYPQELFDLLDGSERQAVAIELLRLSEARTVLTALEDAGISVLVLKGTALAYGLYRMPHYRSRGDNDILLESAQAVEAASAVLKKNGYVFESLMPSPGKNAISFEVEYRRTSQYGMTHVLDIHWALANNALYGRCFTYAELMADARELPQLGEKAKGLGWAHAMAHACVHRVAHLPDGLGGRLIWLYDMHLLSGQFTQTDWDRVLLMARNKHLAGAFYDGLQETVKAFHTSLPHGFLLELQHLAKQESFDVGKASSAVYIDWHSLKWMSFKQRWHWISQTCFPPIAYMKKRDGLKSNAQLPFAYAKRLFRRVTKKNPS